MTTLEFLHATMLAATASGRSDLRGLAMQAAGVGQWNMMPTRFLYPLYKEMPGRYQSLSEFEAKATNADVTALIRRAIAKEEGKGT
jgi:hypothetical protein